MHQDNLGFFLHTSVARHPDDIAIIDLTGPQEREIRYRDLDAAMNRAAAALAAMGLMPGERVAVVAGNRVEYIEAVFGAMRAGLVPVPVNTKLGADLLDYVLRDSGARAVIVAPSCNPHIVGAVERCGIPHRLAFDPVPAGWESWPVAVAQAAPDFTPPDLPPGAVAMLPYTSGSTGRPKGVLLTHAGALWHLRTSQSYWRARKDDRAIVSVPLFHKNAMVLSIKPKLWAGASVVLMDGFDARRYLEAMARWRVTEAGGVPAVLALLLQHRDLIDRLDLSALRLLRIGSAPCHEALLTAAREAFGVPCGQGYGLTETSGGVLGRPADGRPVPPGSVGVPWPVGEYRLVDADGNDSPTAGELWIRTPGVTAGYHNLPDLTAERLRDGFLRTGDLFAVDAEGFWYFQGRTDDMFKAGGEAVYPKEVEDLLLTHPAVAQAAVTPLPHPTKGMVPGAVVVTATGAAVTPVQLKEHCLRNGPAHAHPRRIVLAPSLPLTGAGKVDYHWVRAELLRDWTP